MPHTGKGYRIRQASSTVLCAEESCAGNIVWASQFPDTTALNHNASRKLGHHHLTVHARLLSLSTECGSGFHSLQRRLLNPFEETLRGDGQKHRLRSKSNYIQTPVLSPTAFNTLGPITSFITASIFPSVKYRHDFYPTGLPEVASKTVHKCLHTAGI